MVEGGRIDWASHGNDGASMVQDLIELKQSGMSDDVIQAIVVASSQRRGEDYDRAWDMLNGMGLEVRVRP